MDHAVETTERTFTIDEFLTAYADRPGKYELVDGKVVTVFDPLATGEEGELVNERALHAGVKLNVAIALRQAFTAAGVPLVVFGDGMGVYVAAGKLRCPDAVAIPPGSFEDDTLIFREPVLLCEVVSPTTARTDLSIKVREYFSIPTVRAYVVVDASNRIVLLHTRQQGASAPDVEVVDGELVLAGLGDNVGPVAVDTALFWMK